MVGAKEICALLLAGSMGAGSVVAVQKARPAGVQRPAKAPKPAQPRPRPVADRPAPSGQYHCDDQGVGVPSPLVLVPLPENESAIGMGGSAGGLPAFAGSAIALPPVVGRPPGAGGGFGGTGGPNGGPGIGPGSGGTPPSPPVAPPVPEPEAWVMMMSGFGLIGLALRRNRPETA